MVKNSLYYEIIFLNEINRFQSEDVVKFDTE